MALTTIDTYGIKDGAVQIDDIGTLAGNLTINDSGKLRLGTGLDLQLYHDGSKSVVADTGTGGLFVAGSSISLTDAAITETLLYAVPNGAVELYHNNVKKFETTSTGATISGDLTVTSTSPGIWFTDTNSDPDWRILNLDGTLGVYDVNASRYALQFEGDADVLIPTDTGKLKFGASQDLEIFHNGSHSFIKDVGTGNLAICGSIVAVHASDATENMILCSENGAVNLYYDHSKKLETTSYGTLVTGRLTTTGNITAPDNAHIQLGDGIDLDIYHDGSNSWIDDAGTGALKIRSQAGGVQILGQSNNNLCAQFDTDGAVSLYHNNVYKAATTSAGFRVNGDFWVDNQTNAGRDLYFDESADSLIFYDNTKAAFGGGSDLQIYHDGTHSYIKNTHATGYTLLQVANGEYGAKLIPNGACELYYDNSKKFETTSVGVTVSGTLTTTSHIDLPDSCELLVGNSDDLRVYHSGTTNYIVASSHNLHIDTASGNENSAKFIQNGAVELYFDNSKKFNTESWGITVTGDIKIGDNKYLLVGDGNDFSIKHDGSNTLLYNGTGSVIHRTPSYYQWYNSDGSETLAKFSVNAGCQLYYNNGIRFETTNWGSQFHGGLRADDSIKLQLGSSDDLQIYHNGTHSRIDNYTGNLYINAASGETGISVIANGSIDLYYDNSKKFETNSSGCQVTGTLWADGIDTGDNEKLLLGDGDDLQIYHNGSDSFVRDQGTGGLYLTGSVVGIKNSSANENGLLFTENGAVELYYDNSKKLGTASWGTQIFGNLQLDDNNILKLGNGGDLLLYHDGSHSYVQDNGTGDLYVQSNSSISIKAADEDSIKCIANGAVQLFYDNSEKIKTISTGVEVTGGIRLGGGTSSNEMSDYEEGTYTIGSVNPSYPHSSQDGKYIKIGRMCFCYGSVTFGNHTDSAHAGVVNPFTADAGRPGALLVRYTSFSGGYKLTGHVSASSTGVTFYYSDNSNAVTYGDLQNKRLDFMIVYATNA